MARPRAAFALWAAIAALDLLPCLNCAAAILARPSSVFGPVLLPPWRWHLPFMGLPMRLQGVPERVFARHKAFEGFLLVIVNKYPMVSWGLSIASSGASGLTADHADTGSLGAVSPASSSSGRLSSPDIIFSNLIKNIFDNLRAVLVIRRPPS